MEKQRLRLLSQASAAALVLALGGCKEPAPRADPPPDIRDADESEAGGDVASPPIPEEEELRRSGWDPHSRVPPDWYRQRLRAAPGWQRPPARPRVRPVEKPEPPRVDQ